MGSTTQSPSCDMFVANERRKTPTSKLPGNGSLDLSGRRGHEYHAEANLLSGALRRPIVQEIPEQAALCLRDWRGGHLHQRVQHYDLEGLITFKRGYTRVSGYRGLKTGNPFVTLSTAVIEDLNVFDVVTADRVVVQISTEHPEPTKDGKDLGHVPRVHFLGTRFDNLRISGVEISTTLNPEICPSRPAADVPYLFNQGFLDKVKSQVTKVKAFQDVPQELKDRSEEFLQDYTAEAKEIECLEELVKNQPNGEPMNDEPKNHKLVCSLFNTISIPASLPGVTAVENVIYARDFGILTLGSLEVGRTFEGYDENKKPMMSNYFTLRMLDMRLGCVGDGKVVAASGSGNGKGKP